MPKSGSSSCIAIALVSAATAVFITVPSSLGLAAESASPPDSLGAAGDRRFIVELTEPPAAAGGPGAARRADAGAQRARVRQTILRLEAGRAGRAAAPLDPVRVIQKEYRVVLNGFATTLGDGTVAELARDPDVRRVVPDGTVSAILDTTVPHVRAPEVWQDLGIRGAGITVAVIDTGVDYTHPDLGGCFAAGCKVVGGHDFVNDDGDPMDDHGHGTHVAATVAGNGRLVGVAPDATLLAFKVLDDFGYGFFSDVIAGIERATDPNDDGDPRDHVRIISMSLGGGGDEDDPVSTAVDNATAAGVLSVIAAGNSGEGYSTIGSPGTARTAVTVGAVDDSDVIAPFSSRGPTAVAFLAKPDLVAPGVDVCAATIGGAFPGSECLDDRHASISGTSMATPHVAGAAALLLSLRPSLSPLETKAMLRASAVPLGLDVVTSGAGRLDARAAMDVATVISPAPVDLGLDSVSSPTWQRSVPLVIHNLAPAAKTYAFTVAADAFPPGVTASVTPATLRVAAGASAEVTLTVTVDNALVPDSTVPPYLHEGSIVVTSGVEQQTVHVSFAKFEPPANDSCGNATTVTERQFTTTVDTSHATTDPDDPVSTCGCERNGHTVWYRFTAAHDGIVVAAVHSASPFGGTDATETHEPATRSFPFPQPAVVGAYSGTCGALSPVGQCSLGTDVETVFPVKGGLTYFVEVAGVCGGSGTTVTFTLDQDPPPPPANDTCSTATEADSLPFANVIDTRTAMADPDGPPSSCNCSPSLHTVWYRFQAPRDERLTIHTFDSDYLNIIEVFTGDCANLVPLGRCQGAASSGVLTFDASAGVTYHVRVATYCEAKAGTLAFHVVEGLDPYDHPMLGQSLVIRDDSRAPARRSVTLTTHGDAIVPPEADSATDPRTAGAWILLNNPRTFEFDGFFLPAQSWKAIVRKGVVSGYRYGGKGAFGPCTSVVIVRGKIKAACRGDAIGYSLDEPAQESIAVTLYADPHLYCTTFGGKIVNDTPASGKRAGTFRARNAPAPATCR